MGRALSTHALNRALLARQGLLTRRRRSVPAAIAAAGGLQTQEPRDAYVALFARTEGFSAARLERAMQRGDVVRGSWLRCTIHTVTRADYLAHRALLDGVIGPAGSPDRAAYGGYEVADAAAAAAALLADGEPRTARQIGEALQPAFPQAQLDWLTYCARHHLRLVMPHVPGARWGFPRPPVLAPAAATLGEPLAEGTPLASLLLQGIAAIGPCSAADLRTWSGLTGIAAALEPVRGQLRSFEGPDGRELLDLPGAPRPRPSTPAAVRLLGEFDNACLSHASRERIIDPGFAHVYRVGRNGRRDHTVLIDGFVRATWKLARRRDEVELAVSLFERERGDVIDELRREALGVAQLLEPGAAEHRVVIARA